MITFLTVVNFPLSISSLSVTMHIIWFLEGFNLNQKFLSPCHTNKRMYITYIFVLVGIGTLVDLYTLVFQKQPVQDLFSVLVQLFGHFGKIDFDQDMQNQSLKQI